MKHRKMPVRLGKGLKSVFSNKEPNTQKGLKYIISFIFFFMGQAFLSHYAADEEDLLRGWCFL